MSADRTTFQIYACMVPNLLAALEEKQCPCLDIGKPWLADRSLESKALKDLLEEFSGQVQHGHEQCPL